MTETIPLFLQIKEAQASVLEPYVGASLYPNHGERVVQGQRLMQSASDIFLGWTRADSTDYYVRQLRDMKLSEDIETMTKEEFDLYAQWLARALARGHARSGDPAQISGYLGSSDVFEEVNCLIRQGVCGSDRARPRSVARRHQGRSNKGCGRCAEPF